MDEAAESCTHQVEQLSPFVHLPDDPEMWECLACGALLEAIRSSEQVTYLVTQDLMTDATRDG